MINYVNSIFYGFQNKQMNLWHQKYPGMSCAAQHQYIFLISAAHLPRGIFHKKYRKDYGRARRFLCFPYYPLYLVCFLCVC